MSSKYIKNNQYTKEIIMKNKTSRLRYEIKNKKRNGVLNFIACLLFLGMCYSFIINIQSSD